MPKKDHSSSDDYEIYTCDTDSISSYIVTTDDFCDDSCDTIKCHSDSCCSSKCSCNSSSCSSPSCSSSSKCHCSSDCSSEYSSYSSHCEPRHYKPRCVPQRTQNNVGISQMTFADQVPAPATSVSAAVAPVPADTSRACTISRDCPPGVDCVDGQCCVLQPGGACTPAENVFSSTISPAPADPATTATVGGLRVLPPSSVTALPSRSFRSIITPIMDLRTPYSPRTTGSVAFTMRKRNDVVTMQHEPLSATIAANGVNHLAVRQSIGDLPTHPVDASFVYRLNGEGRTGIVRIDPLDSSANIKFFLGQDDKTTVNRGDTVEIPGTTTSWITTY